MKNQKKSENKHIYSLIIRYLLLVASAYSNLAIFYIIFSPLTIYPVFFLLSLFFNASLSSNIISIANFNIYLIDACIAGSAYYLLLILNLSTPNIKKRISAILFSFASFLIINILRIFIFSILFVNSFSLFFPLHLFFWYFLSIVIVVIIWFAEVRLFKIKNIPFFTDISFLYNAVKGKK